VNQGGVPSEAVIAALCTVASILKDMECARPGPRIQDPGSSCVRKQYGSFEAMTPLFGAGVACFRMHDLCFRSQETEDPERRIQNMYPHTG